MEGDVGRGVFREKKRDVNANMVALEIVSKN